MAEPDKQKCCGSPLVIYLPEGTYMLNLFCKVGSFQNGLKCNR